MCFSTSFPVRFGDCDPAGIAYYPRLFALVDAAIEDWTAAIIGVNRRAMHTEHRCGLPTRSLASDFSRPCRLGETLDLAVAVHAVSARSVTLSVAGSVEGEGRFVVELVQVLMDLDTACARAWPTEWHAALESALCDAAPLLV